MFLIPHPEFFDQLGGIGGHVSHVYGVLGGLEKCGLEAEILTGDGQAQLVESGYKVQEVPPVWNNRVSFALSFMKMLKSKLTQEKYEFVYMRYVASFAPFIPFLKKMISPLPLVLEVNSFASQSYKFFRPFDQRVFSASDVIIAVSQMLVEDITRIGGDRNIKKILHLINGVDPERFQCDPQPIIPYRSGQTYIGYIGVLKPYYGLEELVDSHLINWPSRKDLETIIVGEGPIREALQKRAGDCGGIHFHKPIPYEKAPSVMRGLDIVVSTISPKNRCGLSTKIFEYMASRRPIIVGRIMETKLLLKEGEEAIFYATGNAESLARAVCKLADDPQLQARLAERAWQKVVTKHSWHNKMKKIINQLNKKRAIEL